MGGGGDSCQTLTPHPIDPSWPGVAVASVAAVSVGVLVQLNDVLVGPWWRL